MNLVQDRGLQAQSVLLCQEQAIELVRPIREQRAPNTQDRRPDRLSRRKPRHNSIECGLKVVPEDLHSIANTIGVDIEDWNYFHQRELARVEDRIHCRLPAYANTIVRSLEYGPAARESLYANTACQFTRPRVVDYGSITECDLTDSGSDRPQLLWDRRSFCYRARIPAAVLKTSPAAGRSCEGGA